MKGTLHKTESGWHVINMQATLNGPLLQSLPLIDNGYIDGLMLYDSNEGLEVEFEIVDFPSNSISKYAKLVSKEYLVTAPWITMKGGEGWDKILDKAIEDKATRPVTEDDAWLTMKEGDITINFKPMPEFDDPKYPDYPTRAEQLREQAWDTIWKDFRANKNASYSWALLEYLRDNYNPPTKKQD